MKTGLAYIKLRSFMHACPMLPIPQLRPLSDLPSKPLIKKWKHYVMAHNPDISEGRAHLIAYKIVTRSAHESYMMAYKFLIADLGGLS